MNLLSLSFVASLAVAAQAVTSSVTLASGQYSAASPLPKSMGAISIESCYIIDYLGDLNSPNKLSLQLLQNIQDLTGEPPRIRVGGHTQDVSQYCDTCTATITNKFSSGNAEAYSVIYNKNLFSVLNNNVPSNQKIILGVNLGQNSVQYPQAEVAAAEKYMLSTRLLSYELGNEPDFYSSSQRARPWYAGRYASQIVSWINQIVSATGTKKNWWIGSFAQEPQSQGNFSLPEMTTLGVVSQIHQQSNGYSDHTYPYSICDTTRAAKVSLPGLMSHATTVSYFSQWASSIASAKQAGVPFYMGETGSVSCHGKDGVSNTLGAALWEIDYMLNGATMGMSGVYFHAGTPFYYSMWRPVASSFLNGAAAAIFPTYYSLLSLATATGNLTDPYVVALKASSSAASSNLAAYAIYDSQPGATTKPSSVIILNLNYYSMTSSSARPIQDVDVSSVLGISATSNVQVRRLTAKGADSITGATFAGQDWTIDGTARGTKNVETVAANNVQVSDSEGVLVEL